MSKLYIVGLGIGTEKDISLKGIEACRNAEAVFAEFYTCPVDINISSLEKIIGKKITVLERKDVEEKGTIIKSAKEKDTAFLVGGDPLSATTHSEIILSAKKHNIDTKIIHASSIFSAIAETGLHLYKFGKTVSLPFPQENFFPLSPYDLIFDNLRIKAHTLVLLDIGMTANKCFEILLKLENTRNKKIISEEMDLIVVSHLGNESTIKYGKMKNLKKLDFGKMPHSIIIPSELNFQEKEFLTSFKI